MRNMFRLLPTTIIPFISFCLLIAVSLASQPVLVGLVFLSHVLMLPLALWLKGRSLRVKLQADPPARTDVLWITAPTVFLALGMGANLYGMAVWALIALIPYVALWFGLGLHRRDARLV